MFNEKQEITVATEVITRNLLLLAKHNADVDELFTLIGQFQQELKKLKE